jgi:hypothetical protein
MNLNRMHFQNCINFTKMKLSGVKIGTFLIAVTVMFSTIVFSTSACKKKKVMLKISGHVYDSDLNQNVAGANVILSGNGLEGGVYSPGFKTINTTVTDANGYYEFSFEKDQSDTYRVFLSKNQYFSITEEFSSSRFDSSVEIALDLELRPAGYVKIHLKNEYPSDDDDQIIFSFTNTAETCLECCNGTPRTGNGPAFDTTFTCMFYGNNKIHFMRSVTKDQHTNVYADSLYCPAFATETYEILY